MVSEISEGLFGAPFGGPKKKRAKATVCRWQAWRACLWSPQRGISETAHDPFGPGRLQSAWTYSPPRAIGHPSGGPLRSTYHQLATYTTWSRHNPLSAGLLVSPEQGFRVPHCHQTGRAPPHSIGIAALSLSPAPKRTDTNFFTPRLRHVPAPSSGARPSARYRGGVLSQQGVHIRQIMRARQNQDQQQNTWWRNRLRSGDAETADIHAPHYGRKEKEKDQVLSVSPQLLRDCAMRAQKTVLTLRAPRQRNHHSECGAGARRAGLGRFIDASFIP